MFIQLRKYEKYQAITEHDQEIPHLHITEQHTAPWGRGKILLQPRGMKKTIKAKQAALSSSLRCLQN